MEALESNPDKRWSSAISSTMCLHSLTQDAEGNVNYTIYTHDCTIKHEGQIPRRGPFCCKFQEFSAKMCAHQLFVCFVVLGIEDNVLVDGSQAIETLRRNPIPSFFSCKCHGCEQPQRQDPFHFCAFCQSAFHHPCWLQLVKGYGRKMPSCPTCGKNWPIYKDSVDQAVKRAREVILKNPRPAKAARVEPVSTISSPSATMSENRPADSVDASETLKDATSRAYWSRRNQNEFTLDHWVVMTGDRVVMEHASYHVAKRAMLKCPEQCLFLQVGHENEPMNLFLVQAEKKGRSWYIKAALQNQNVETELESYTFLVDTGADYNGAPKQVLKRLNALDKGQTALVRTFLGTSSERLYYIDLHLDGTIVEGAAFVANENYFLGNDVLDLFRVVKENGHSFTLESIPEERLREYGLIL